MKQLNKRMKILKKEINTDKQYDIKEGLKLLKKMSNVKFIETVDVAINLGIDPKKSNQNIRGFTKLPHEIGKKNRIAVFAEGENAKLAKKHGINLVGMDDLLQKIKNGERRFDIVLASPESMKLVSSLGQILGPRGLMPNLKMGTITMDIDKTIKEIQTNQIRYRNDKFGIVHVSIGKINLDITKLRENLETVLISLKKNKPKQTKGIFFKKISLSTTMGASIIINQMSLSSKIS